MSTRLRTTATILALSAVAALAACAPPSSTSTSPAASATSADDLGGMEALVAAAQEEGEVNVIALPDDWANYGAIKEAFTAKYGITVNDQNPTGSSQEEITAITQNEGTGKGPDVVDVTMSVALANTDLFAPYQVATWADIADDQKERTGLWVQDYGGYMAVGYASDEVPAVTSVQDLLKSDYAGTVALTGDPTGSGSAQSAVLMTSLANGGSADDIQPGIDFFGAMKDAGTFVNSEGSASTAEQGTTNVIIDWDYLQAGYAASVPGWEVYVPEDALLGGYYAQAVSADAPHPAAARLWQEFLYSDAGQNLYLAGGAHPVRQEAMTEAGTVDAEAAAALPEVSGTPVFPTEEQSSAAATALTAGWAAAIS